MAPCLGREATSLVGPQHSEVHEKERLGVKARET
jgi:hypothetical protein